MDCRAGELQPGGFGFAVEVGGEGAVEGFELGQIYLDTVVDDMLEIIIGKTAESWQCSADHICVVAMNGAGAHVAKYPGVVDWMFVVCQVLKVSAGRHNTLLIKVDREIRYFWYSRCGKAEMYELTSS